MLFILQAFQQSQIHSQVHAEPSKLPETPLSVSGSQRSRKPRNQPLPHLARGQISPGHASAPGVGPEYQQFNDSPWSARPQGNTQGHILETHIRTNGRKYGIIYFWVRVGEAGECSLPSDPHSLGLQTSVCPNAPTVHI